MTTISGLRTATQKRTTMTLSTRPFTTIRGLSCLRREVTLKSSDCCPAPGCCRFHRSASRWEETVAILSGIISTTGRTPTTPCFCAAVTRPVACSLVRSMATGATRRRAAPGTSRRVPVSKTPNLHVYKIKRNFYSERVRETLRTLKS